MVISIQQKVLIGELQFFFLLKRKYFFWNVTFAEWWEGRLLCAAEVNVDPAQPRYDQELQCAMVSSVPLPPVASCFCSLRFGWSTMAVEASICRQNFPCCNPSSSEALRCKKPHITFEASSCNFCELKEKAVTEHLLQLPYDESSSQSLWVASYRE